MTKGKKIFRSIIGGLLAILAIIVLTPFLIVYFLYLPFAILRYHRTPYYKDLKRKYGDTLVRDTEVHIYNRIKKKSLPIAYAENGDTAYFLKDGTVYLTDRAGVDFWENDGRWVFDLADEDEAEDSASTDEANELAETAKAEPCTCDMEAVIEASRARLREEHREMPVKFICCLKRDNKWLEMAKQCPYVAFFENDDFV